MTRVLIRDVEETHREEGEVLTEAETGVMSLQTKEHQAACQEVGERQDTDPPSEPAGGTNLADPLLLNSCLQNCKREQVFAVWPQETTVK